MKSELFKDPRLAWMKGDSIRPYVFVRRANQIIRPGTAPLDWFPTKPIIKDPQAMESASFTDQILNLENKVFGVKLAMPRWVFYDCAIMPGITTGFVIHRDAASPEIRALTEPTAHCEWLPLSLFITIPSLRPGEWVAHNLSSINSGLPESQKFYGLGFLSKAFGLWYSNIETCCGMTQWQSPAIKLHSHYGDIEILTAYTPSHTYPQTLTYRLKVNSSEWGRFFNHQRSERFLNQYEKSDLTVLRRDEGTLKSLQARIERGDGPYFLDAHEIDEKPLDSELSIFLPR